MDRAHIDEHHVIDRYARGALSGSELEAFECYLLDHPEIIEDIEYAKAMHGAIERNAELLTGTGAGSVTDMPTGSTGFLFSRGYAMAATVLLAIAVPFGGFLLNESRQLRDQLQFLEQPAGVGSEIILEQTRGDSAVTFSFPADGALLLRVDVGPEEVGAYKVSIKNDSGYVWHGSGLAVDAMRLVSVVVPSLSPGTYSLAVATEPSAVASRTLVEYRFVVSEGAR